MTESPLLSVQGLVAHGMSCPVDLTVHAGEVWVLVGESGVGKSQLLKAIADLIPHQGEVVFAAHNQRELSPEIWRSQVMYFAAETAWWLDSIGEHFEPQPNQATLKALGLPESILNKHPDECSSGEKQRLALLRGLALQPRVLLLDEITANLDGATAQKVEALLLNYLQTRQADQSKQSAIIWVSHDIEQHQRIAPSHQHLTLKKEVGA